MAARTEAQEEYDNILAASSKDRGPHIHPEDRSSYNANESDEADEETSYRNNKIENNMKMPALDISSGGGRSYNLPHASFDSGRTTGVKGVIADARAYEEARRREGGRLTKVKSVAQGQGRGRSDGRGGDGESYLNSDSDDDEFLEQWRESRKMEIMKEGNDIRNRRTSPSVRRFGRFDEVDAMGYLDAIEKVGRETVVAVFVYDPECPVSQVIETSLQPLVAANPAVHFVKVHYEDIEFDNAGVPAILGYKNQGDLFANLTYIIDQIPDDTLFDTQALKDVLKKHRII